jgi:hypothetical protein
LAKLHRGPVTCMQGPLRPHLMKNRPFHIYLRQPDRRLYPCIVLRDQQGMVAVHAAPVGRAVSEVTAQEVEVLRTFRGAEQMRVKPVPHHRRVRGKWKQTRPNQFSYMLSRPDVMARGVNWAWRLAQSEAKVRAIEQAKRAPLFDPHALSGMKPHQRNYG